MSEEWIEALLTSLKTYLTANYPYEETLTSECEVPLDDIGAEQNPFANARHKLLAGRNKTFNDKNTKLLLLYVRTKLLMREKQRNYYSKLLKGLPPNSLNTLNKDLKLQYQLPRHWYFRKQLSRDSSESSNTSCREIPMPTSR
ncbi:hypothetical protein ABMA28_001015 [Loxostege sticticalis]|uniref:Uncharacterized protein n=1 Tax=Loxostege sticticalis TaxID=481309 RepID=A0ABD0T729_LOXSC